MIVAWPNQFANTAVNLTTFSESPLIKIHQADHLVTLIS